MIGRFLRWAWRLACDIWFVLRRPSVHFSLGFLTIGGFVAGIMFWGGFNTALELTNTETFCISCHEMRDNVYQELQTTIHFTNRSGVRATCPDCHVPHQWTDKIARKMQASKEVWGKIFGTISTREKFLEKRRELAEHEWARLKANDSLECRNCHDFEYMDFTRQNTRAAEAHGTYLAAGEKTCIDCHKGIAHHLPDMQGVPGWDPLQSFYLDLPAGSDSDRVARLSQALRDIPYLPRSEMPLSARPLSATPLSEKLASEQPGDLATP